MQIKVKKLHEDAILPTYGTDGAACFDLYALDAAVLLADGAAIVRTGLSFEIPEGYVMLVYSRSGHGFKHDVRLSNCVGVIDSDYRGELMIKLRCDHPDIGLVTDKHERVAQALLVPIPRIEFVETETLSNTDRGTGGFGSTGA